MALASVLSEKGLARFRTKRCERLLATGECGFFDRCQYSHESTWLRRNPLKARYVPELCPMMGQGDNSTTCRMGAECNFAHSMEEVLFHPSQYKTRRCAGGSACMGYYCPLAYSDDELRTPTLPVTSTTTQVSLSTTESLPDGSQWCKIDDCLCVDRAAMGLTTPVQVNEGLHGSRRIAGLLRDKTDMATWHPCEVRLIGAGRTERDEAALVIRELRKWMSPDSSSQTCHRHRGLTIRRTVATICLVLPSHDVDSRSLTPISKMDPILREDNKGISMALASSLLRGLVEELKGIHNSGIAHLCISPGTVLLDHDKKGAADENSTKPPQLLLGDFLGKVRSLTRLAGRTTGSTSGQKGLDEAWAIWQPPEILEKVKCGGDDVLDYFKVDSWQLGVVICYFLTGMHPFGPLDDPELVCQNISNNLPVNLDHLASRAPIFADVVSVLLTSSPATRLSVNRLFGHPALWDFDVAATFASSIYCKFGWSSCKMTIEPPPGLVQPELRSMKLPLPEGAVPLTFDIDLTELSSLPALYLLSMTSTAEGTCCMDFSDVKSGSILRCIWNGGVRFRHSKRREDKTTGRVEVGGEIKVLERSDDWVRSRLGWLPLEGVEDAACRNLFEVVKKDSDEAVSEPQTPTRKTRPTGLEAMTPPAVPVRISSPETKTVKLEEVLPTPTLPLISAELLQAFTEGFIRASRAHLDAQQVAPPQWPYGHYCHHQAAPTYEVAHAGQPNTWCSGHDHDTSQPQSAWSEQEAWYEHSYEHQQSAWSEHGYEASAHQAAAWQKHYQTNPPATWSEPAPAVVWPELCRQPPVQPAPIWKEPQYVAPPSYEADMTEVAALRDIGQTSLEYKQQKSSEEPAFLRSWNLHLDLPSSNPPSPAPKDEVFERLKSKLWPAERVIASSTSPATSDATTAAPLLSSPSWASCVSPLEVSPPGLSASSTEPYVSAEEQQRASSTIVSASENSESLFHSHPSTLFQRQPPAGGNKMVWI